MTTTRHWSRWAAWARAARSAAVSVACSVRVPSSSSWTYQAPRGSARISMTGIVDPALRPGRSRRHFCVRLWTPTSALVWPPRPGEDEQQPRDRARGDRLAEDRDGGRERDGGVDV